MECAELDQPSRAWCAAELRQLKKKRLREKDKIARVLTMMRRHPRSASAEKLGSGHYGEVLLGRSALHGPVAVKVVPHDEADSSPSQLAREAAVLSAVDGAPGFPRLHHHGRQTVMGRPSDVLVMELLGPSLEDLIWQSAGGTRFTTPTVLRLGRELLSTLRELHAAGYVHNDLKPSNVLLGAHGSGREATLHLVDFGISTTPGEATPPGESRGTPLFASASAHAGRPTLPIDDVESLCYCLAFLATGSLPWERRPPSRAAALKRRLLAPTDLDGAASTHSRARPAKMPLAEHLPSAGAAGAIDALWAHVVMSRRAPGGEVDYEACLDALGEELGAEWDWERNPNASAAADLAGAEIDC